MICRRCADGVSARPHEYCMIMLCYAMLCYVRVMLSIALQSGHHRSYHRLYASYRVGRCMYHTPPRAVFQGGLLDNQEGANSANTEPYVFGKLSARRFQCRPFRHRHYSNCGDIHHGTSGQGGVIVWHTPSYTVTPYMPVQPFSPGYYINHRAVGAAQIVTIFR